MMQDRLVKSELVYPGVALVGTKDSGGYEKLAGVHKVAIALTPNLGGWTASMKAVAEFLKSYDQDFKFSVSLYSDSGSKEDYESIISDILAEVRRAGFRKANLIRPGSGTEVLAKDVATRRIVDFVVVKVGKHYWTGVTSFVPDVQQFQLRSNERPVVSSDISISARLAKLLLNISGIRKGETALDPFCGSGTILMEALLMGTNAVGVDRDPVRIENAKRNLEWLQKTYKVASGTFSLKVGDATQLRGVISDAHVDVVVSEPIFLPRINFAPSLERARKLIRNSSRLYSEALYSIADVVSKGGRVVLVVPSLKTAAERDVSVLLEDVQEAGLRPFRPAQGQFEYPLRISSENTRWVRRLIYVFERL